MRISDWSSDVCSSDLPAERFLKIDESCFLIGTAFQTFEFAKSRYVRTNFFTQFVLEWQASFTGIVLGDLENVINGRIMRFVNRDDFPSIAIDRSEEHTSELQSLMRISYAVFCLKKK